MNYIFKRRLDSTIYGLIYPAFFGNMVYDIILFLKGDDKICTMDGITGIIILVYALVDFMHLYGDMNKIVKKPNRKSTRYLLCDAFTSLLIFISFVFIINKSYTFIIIFSLIPLVIFQYKKKNPESNRFFKIYSWLSIIGGSLGAVFGSIFKDYFSAYIFIFISLSTLAYGYFVLYYYEKKCMNWDIAYMDNKENEY